MRRTTSAAIVTIALLLGGCAAVSSDHRAAEPAHPFRSGQLHELRDRFAGYSADFDPVNSPSALASLSSDVVVGKLIGLENGRSQGKATDQVVDTKYVVLVIEVSGELKGDNHPVGAVLRIEIPSPLGQVASAYSAAFPSGTTVVGYLVPTSPSGTNEMNAADSDPLGKLTYLTPVNPQGLIVKLADGSGFAAVQESSFSTTARLADLLPGGDTVLSD